VAARGDVRRAKLYYLRDRVGKRARVRERRYVGPEEVVEGGLLYETEATDASGMTADEVVDAEGGVDLAAETPETEAAEGEASAEPAAEATAEAEAPAEPGQPEPEGEPAPDAEQA
jgi:large subunit ribosomal protein L19